MKKNLEKILASASIVVALVLIMILLVAAFGGIDFEEFNSKLVRGLIVTLGVLYAILAGVALTLIFLSNDAVKEIILRSEQEGSVRASIGVVRKLVKDSCAGIEGVKCQKVSLVTNDYGVRLKVSVKVIDKDVLEVETYIRTLLEDVFMGALGFRFHAIEIKVTSLEPRYKADKAAIEEKVDQKLAAISENAAEDSDGDISVNEIEAQEAPESVQSEPETAVAVETVSEDTETADDREEEKAAENEPVGSKEE